MSWTVLVVLVPGTGTHVKGNAALCYVLSYSHTAVEAEPATPIAAWGFALASIK